MSSANLQIRRDKVSYTSPKPTSTATVNSEPAQSESAPPSAAGGVVTISEVDARIAAALRSAVSGGLLLPGATATAAAKAKKDSTISGKFGDTHGQFWSFGPMQFAFGKNEGRNPPPLLTKEEKAAWLLAKKGFSAGGVGETDVKVTDPDTGVVTTEKTALSWGFNPTLVNPFYATEYMVRATITIPGTIDPPPNGLKLHWYQAPHWLWADGFGAYTDIIINSHNLMVTRVVLSPPTKAEARLNGFFRLYVDKVYAISYPVMGGFDAAIEDEAIAKAKGL